MGFFLDGGDGLVQNLRIILAPAVKKFDVSLDDRQRSPQFMRCVRYKLALLGISRFHSIQQRVEGIAQISQLIPCIRNPNPVPHISHSNGINRSAHVVDGLEAFMTHIAAHRQ
ncbi:hypothetical protein SDC9_182864 [bioreactor metagenome]|uniref:Uncharacterized protein n=1 Tax=bioreactor metagenome TaxID=1076179 RepID=A0A645HA13_9ZZZZ